MNRTRSLTRLLAALALTAPLAAVADDRRDRDYGERRDARDRQEQRFDARYVRRGDVRAQHWRGRGWHGQWRNGRWRYPQARGWRHGRRTYWDYGPRWQRRWDRSSFITGALIGSTLTRSALHDRGDHRYCEHRSAHGGTVSCYRVERLPGGRERRVPLPNAACF